MKVSRRAVLAIASVAAGGVLVSGSFGQSAPDPPNLAVVPPTWSSSANATFEFSAAGADSFRCVWDSAVEDPCISPASRSLVEGRHDFQVVARDASGNESTSSSYSWTVDLTPPQLPADDVVEAMSPAGAIVVFGAIDNLDPTPALSCNHASGSPFSLGITTVSCTATDAAGNQTSGSFTVTVEDTTPPTLAPRPDVIRQQESAQGAVVDYARPNAQDIADPSPTVQCAPAPGSVFPVGETDVTCIAVDDAGLRSDPTTFKVVVQQGAIPAKPGITPSVPRLTNERQASFQLELGPGVTAECRLEGPLGSGSFAPCSEASPPSYVGLADGPHLFTVQVTNGVGNVNQASYAWTVDATAPASVARFSARPGYRTVRLSWTKPIDVDYDSVRIWRKRAGSSTWRRLADRVDTALFRDSTVSNHVRYLYRIRSFDIAGNASAPAGASAWPTPILRPRYDAIVHSAPLVDWRGVRKATYYNMQVWRDGRKLLSVWPAASQYRLRSSWTFLGRRHLLAGGRVTVYLWAGFGSKAAARYGPLYGQTRFTLG